MYSCDLKPAEHYWAQGLIYGRNTPPCINSHGKQIMRKSRCAQRRRKQRKPMGNKLRESLAVPKDDESRGNPWGTNQEKVSLCPMTAKATET